MTCFDVNFLCDRLTMAAAAMKEDNFTNSQSYKRLLDECKVKYGNDYPE